MQVRRRARTNVSRDEAGHELLGLLVRRFTYHTREEWELLIDEGRVCVNCRAGRGDERLAEGDAIEYLIPDVQEPPVDTEFRIVFEDADILVVDKPGNLPCHPAGRYFENTLWALLAAEFVNEKLQFVNRLDRETSGLLLVARTAEAALACRGQFAGRTVRKGYLTMVEGHFPERCECDGLLVPDTGSPVRKKRRLLREGEVAGDLAQQVSTSFERVCGYGDVSLLSASPTTGRLHQIRASLCSLGFPVVGDKLYGVDDTMFLRFIGDGLTDGDQRRLRMSRQALHAARLEFSHPRTGRPMVLSSPLPEDMTRLIRQLDPAPEGAEHKRAEEGVT